MNWLDDREGNEPKPYAYPDIRAALEAETHRKCAYCEGRFESVSYGHIEHKLPKRKHPMLVCAWENLTLACPRCNTNKGDYDDPECRLLDPHVDDVEKLVVFVGPMALARQGKRKVGFRAVQRPGSRGDIRHAGQGTTPGIGLIRPLRRTLRLPWLARNESRAHATITCLQLNRNGLLFQRTQVLARLNSILDTVQRACNEPAMVRAMWFDIDSLTAADGEYESACRQFLKWQLQERGIAKPAPCH